MAKVELNKPILILLYGFAGSGKTYFARQLTEIIPAAHIDSDRIRYELFENPRYDNAENEIIEHLMEYMAEEFLNAGVSVIFDTNLPRKAGRRFMRDLARKAKAAHVLIWLQIDPDSAFARVAKRDRRRSDDKYAMPLDKVQFDSLAGRMQNPERDEDYLVLSGKHSFDMQRSRIIKRLYDMNLVKANVAANSVVKPGLVNLVPTAGRVDMTRRNITIR